ncbi:MAG: hypothetical protein NC339_00385 [Muribaculaceae bacterium]|nr:hypothetical protein [Muribaculaceae bacterium]
MKKLLIGLALASVISFSAAGADDVNPRKDSFAWGLEIGPGIDMGGDDMSTINIHATLGYRNSWLKMAGVGVGIDMMMSNSCRSFPIYAMVRSSFSTHPKLLFGDLRVGVAYNQATSIPDRTNFYLQPGIGIELASGRSFSSHLILSYSYNAMTFYGDKQDTLIKGLNRVNITIGATF